MDVSWGKVVESECPRERERERIFTGIYSPEMTRLLKRTKVVSGRNRRGCGQAEDSLDKGGLSRPAVSDKTDLDGSLWGATAGAIAPQREGGQPSLDLGGGGGVGGVGSGGGGRRAITPVATRLVVVAGPAREATGEAGGQPASLGRRLLWLRQVLFRSCQSGQEAGSWAEKGSLSRRILPRQTYRFSLGARGGTVVHVDVGVCRLFFSGGLCRILLLLLLLVVQLLLHILVDGIHVLGSCGQSLGNTVCDLGITVQSREPVIKSVCRHERKVVAAGRRSHASVEELPSHDGEGNSL